MLSGGPDSALALKEALTLYVDPVVAYHVNLIHPRQNRYQYELNACQKQVDYCRTNYRYFDYHVASFIANDEAKYPDVPLLGAFASTICNHYKDIDHIWIGEDDVGDTNDTDKMFYGALMCSIYPARNPNTNLKWTNHPTFGTNRTKQKIREDLGEDLWALTWSCRMPDNGKPCNKCGSCERRNATYDPSRV